MPVDRNFFMNSYLMLTNIIQATTFALFIFSLHYFIENKLLLDKLPFLLCDFVVIVTLCYGYIVGSRIHQWQIGGFDVIIPFLLGLTQGIMILSLSKYSQSEWLWFLSYLSVTICLIFAFINAKIKSKHHSSDYRMQEYKMHEKFFVIFGILFIIKFVLSILVFYVVVSVKVTYHFQKVLAFLLTLEQILTFYSIHLWDRNIEKVAHEK